jgi:hypothetical protein
MSMKLKTKNYALNYNLLLYSTNAQQKYSASGTTWRDTDPASNLYQKAY